MGKPAAFMLDYIADKFDLRRDQICMVGDRLDTDILFGARAPAMSSSSSIRKGCLDRKLTENQCWCCGNREGRRAAHDAGAVWRHHGE